MPCNIVLKCKGITSMEEKKWQVKEISIACLRPPLIITILRPTYKIKKPINMILSCLLPFQIIHIVSLKTNPDGIFLNVGFNPDTGVFIKTRCFHQNPVFSSKTWCFHQNQGLVLLKTLGFSWKHRCAVLGLNQAFMNIPSRYVIMVIYSIYILNSDIPPPPSLKIKLNITYFFNALRDPSTRTKP